MQTIYRASDGSEWETQERCDAHEAASKPKPVVDARDADSERMHELIRNILLAVTVLIIATRFIGCCETAYLANTEQRR